jgi:hypothetical protein
MTDKIDTLKEYAPLVKSLAALGFGALGGDSPKSRGIATGLAKSAEKDVRIRQLMDESAKEQAEKDAKAKAESDEKDLKRRLTVANSLKGEQKNNAYDMLGIWDSLRIDAIDVSGGDVPLDLTEIKSMREQVNAPNSGYTDLQKNIINLKFNNALNFAANGDNQNARISIDRAISEMEPAKNYKGFDADGNFQYSTSEADLLNGGFIYGSYSASQQASETKQFKAAVAPLVNMVNALVKRSIFSEDNEDTGKETDHLKILREGAPIVRKINYKAAGLESPTAADMNTPFPRWLQDSYDWEAAVKFINSVVGPLPENMGRREVLGNFIGANIEAIWELAEASRSEDGGYKSNNVTPKKKKTSDEKSDRIATQVSDLKGVDQSNQAEVTKLLKDNGYTPTEIKSIFSQLGWK